MAELFWLSEAQWHRIEPLLPRGRKGAHRVDDRRVLSGIVHMLQSGALARLPCGLRAVHDDLQSIQPLEQTGALVGGLSHLDRKLRRHRHGLHRQHARQGAPLGRRRKRGAYAQAIGRSRGGRTSKLHALTDTKGRPRVLLLTPGNINDIAMAPALLSEAGRPIRRVLGDKGYDANSLRDLLAAQRTIAVIPSTASRKVPIPHDARAYRQRNLVERMCCRLKDYRRVATRYDKLARNFLAGTLIAAALTWWLN